MTSNLEERRKIAMKRFLLLPLLIILVGALIFGGCAKPGPGIPKEIRIGDIVSYTGMYAGFGYNKWGVQAAFEDMNKEGGIYVKEYGAKIPVKWITVDCQSDILKSAPLTLSLIHI